jgi:hypothetical protein
VVASDLVDMSVEVDGWKMLPVSDLGLTTHIIAARVDDQLSTTDIDVVLYEKTAGGWSGTAYDPSVTKEDAMVDLAAELGLADPFGGTWQIVLDPSNSIGIASPRLAFGKGFFVDDPLYFIANQLPDPEPLAQLAESAGLAAGSGAINTGSIGGTDIGGGQSTNCGCDACIQDSIAAGADAFLANPSMLVEEIDDVIGASLAASPGGGCCIERTTCGPISFGPWSCTGWSLNDHNPHTGNCEYVRTAFRLQTIRCSKICSDCLTKVSFTQNRIESGDIFWVTGGTQYPSDCTEPTVSCSSSVFFIQDLTTTNWTPPPPSCP